MKKRCFLYVTFLLFTSCKGSSNSGSHASVLDSLESIPSLSSVEESPIVSSLEESIEESSELISLEESVNISESPSIESPKELLLYSLELNGSYSDCNLIKYGDYEILIDGGRVADKDYIRLALNQFVQDKVLDMLVVTHPDADHIDGLKSGEALSKLNDISLIIDNGDKDGKVEFQQNVIGRFAKEEGKYLSIQEVMETSKDIVIDDYFSIHFLDNAYYDLSLSSNKNNRSVCFYVQFKNTIIFMGGDLEEAGCKSLMELNAPFTSEEQIVVYKALHHASKYTNYDDFLDYINPDYCFVSAGMQLNSKTSSPNYDIHPYMEAMERMKKKTEQVYWAGINGNLSFYFDGESNPRISGEMRRKVYYVYDSISGNYRVVDRAKEKNITFFESEWYQSYIAL